MNKTYLNLDVTFDYAVKKFMVKEPVEIARNADVIYDVETNTFTVPFLGDKYVVSYPNGSVTIPGKTEDVPLNVKILILHYLINANGAPLLNKWISFKELPDGAIYIDPFTRRSIQPMLKYFAEKQDAFVDVAKTLGAKEESLGDTSLTIFVFPKVPITYVIYSGDDEFPASGNILFDASASNYLPTEDYAIVSSLVIFKLGAIVQ